MAVNGSPFALLAELDRLGRANDMHLPVREEVSDQWVGVGFRLGSRRFAAAMDQVVELLKYPELAPVPRTKPWVRGMANVRGNLLPIMDLKSYLGTTHQSSLTRSSRVLAIQVDHIFAGLLVDEVFGMRHFPIEAVSTDPPAEVDGDIAPYVAGSIEYAGEHWLVFSMRALAEHPDFLKVAN